MLFPCYSYYFFILFDLIVCSSPVLDHAEPMSYGRPLFSPLLHDATHEDVRRDDVRGKEGERQAEGGE